MSWYAYTSMRPLRAAAELREAGYEDAFCLMRLDRRKVSRAVRKSTKSEAKPVLALPGYCFVQSPDPWTCSKLRHVGSAVAFNGRRAPIPQKQMDWLLAPPVGFFHDTQIPRFVNRPEPPVVKAGDTVRFMLAAERHERAVESVDGHTLILRINMLGREVRTRVPVEIVEVVESEAAA
jgi:hypothetical protein